jgi:hypothetical protein
VFIREISITDVLANTKFEIILDLFLNIEDENYPILLQQLNAEYEVVMTIVEFFKLNKNLNSDLNLFTFINRDICDTIGVAGLSELSIILFEETIKIIFDLLFISKKYPLIDKLSILPVFIITSLITNKAPINKIVTFIKIWNNHENESEIVSKYVVRLLLETGFMEEATSAKVISEILNEAELTECKYLIEDLELKLQLINLLNKYNPNLSLADVTKCEYMYNTNKVTFKETIIYSSLLNLLKSINKSYDFLQTGVNSLDIVIKYINTQSDINFSSLFEDYILSQGLEIDIPKLLINNKLFLDDYDLDYYRLVNIFLNAKNKVKDLSQAMYDIEQLLSCYNLDKAIIFDLENLHRYYKIQHVFAKNIPDVDLSDFDYKKINTNDILEIFILKKFNIDNITNLDDFIERTEDIFNAFDILKIDYLYSLFLFFFKYQKEKIYLELLINFGENNYKYFETCLAKMKKNRNFNLRIFLNENIQLKLKVLEKTDNYEYLDDAIGATDITLSQKIKFNKDNEDVFCLYDMKIDNRTYTEEFVGNNVKSKILSFISKVGHCDPVQSTS